MDIEGKVREFGTDILGERGSRELYLIQFFVLQVPDILATVADIVQPRTFEELASYGLEGADSEPPA
jgi:internalin A